MARKQKPTKTRTAEKPRRGVPGAKPFEPTDEQRRLVKSHAAYGTPQEHICTLVINPATGAPIDLKTLHKHFRSELDRGMLDANARVVGSLFHMAVGRPAQYLDGKLVRAEQKPEVAAAIFWAKARMGWSERMVVDHNHQFDLSKLTDDELAAFEQLARKAAVAGPVRGGEETTRH